MSGLLGVETEDERLRRLGFAPASFDVPGYLAPVDVIRPVSMVQPVVPVATLSAPVMPNAAVS